MRAGHDQQLLDGAALRRIRHDRGWTLEQLSEATGISISFINDMEHSRRNGSVPTLVRLCQALDCTPEYILTGSPTLNSEPHDLNRTLTRIQHLERAKELYAAENRRLAHLLNLADAMVIASRDRSGNGQAFVTARQEYLEARRGPE